MRVKSLAEFVRLMFFGGFQHDIIQAKNRRTKCVGRKHCRPATKQHSSALAPSVAMTFFGLDKYMERYGHQPGFPDMRQHMSEFDDWQLIVPFEPRPLTILCCPEDRRCSGPQSEACLSRKTLCDDCEVPVCTYCEEQLM